VLVLGPSGSGKSTLTLCLDGLIPHLVDGDYSGRVVVAGLVVADSPVHLLTQETGLVFQDPEAQFCTLTVEDEIAFGPENLGRPAIEIEAAIDRSLTLVGLPDFRSRRLATLSGGEKQRVALAAVLAMDPGVLVLDEPSANLDPRATSELFDLLRRLAVERRHTIVIIEHKLDELIDWIDEVLVLDAEGGLLFSGTPAEAFYDHGADLVASGVWLPQTAELVSALQRCGWPVARQRPLSIADTVAVLSAAPELSERLRVAGPAARAAGAGGAADSPLAEPLLRAENLSYSYETGEGAARVLSRVSVTIERGTFLAIAGANGAGKTTLAALLSGVLEPPRGTVFLEGLDLTEMPLRAISERVGHVFQNPEHQFVSDTVLGELAFSLTAKAGRKGRDSLTSEQRQLAETWLERLGLLPLAEANPFSVSQGQKRRLSVAAMLIRGQACLFLDEPTLGQDERQVDRLMDMMEQFRVEGGTVVMITHDMRLVSEYAEELLVLSGGRLVYAGLPRDFFSRPQLVEQAGLVVPVLGRVANALLGDVGVRAGLLTVRSFVEAAGEPPGPEIGAPR
jgi:energy-coupling factor transport system ATP-binding protein